MNSVGRVGILALVVGVGGLSAGCSARHRQSVADKAGGSGGGPVVLRLGVSDGPELAESRLARYFAAQVAKLSQGRLKIRVTFLAAGSSTPDVEARTIELVRAGRYDLGWVAARAWDELGVTSFQALQAPFLITNYPLLDRVLTSPLATEMLAGLKDEDVVGLALIPGLLRHPISVKRPFVSRADFAGAHIRDLPSRATDGLLQALGAVPVHVSNDDFGSELAQARIDGTELSIINAPIGGILTANVAFFPKVLTLFTGKRAFAGLSDDQQDILREAAKRTLKHNASFPVRTALAFEGLLARQYCRLPGRIVLASKDERAELVRAAQPVYRLLERHPQTKAEIVQIRAMKAALRSPPPIVVPSSCLGPGQQAELSGRRSPSVLNGTYHLLLTAAAARAFGPPADTQASSYPIVITTVLRDGKWMANADQPPDIGTYSITGNAFALRLGDVMRFTFVRDPGGTLHLRPIPPMDRGDQFVWAGAPWLRVGPPTRKIP
ncbi:MAG TPA: TRAP transporter substrate-binding protein DctP [Gaiellaceae bacterium]